MLSEQCRNLGTKLACMVPITVISISLLQLRSISTKYDNNNNKKLKKTTNIQSV